MDLKNIKESTKDSIVQSFMENAKFARRGSQHQRPKSWSKGTKSGSDKKKMRREGKREVRELHESQDWISAAREAFQGHISPADVTKHFQGKTFSSVDHFRSAVKQLANDHADRFISTQDREGQSPEKAMQAWTNRMVGKFDAQIAKQEKAAATNPLRNLDFSKIHTPRDETDAELDQRAIDRFEGRRGAGSWEDYDNQPRSWQESLEHSLRSRLLKEQNPHFPNYDNPEMHGDYGKTVSPKEAERIETLQFAHGPFMKYVKSTHEKDPAGAAHAMLGYLGAMIKGKESHDALHHVISSYHDIKGTAGGHKEIPF